MDLNQLRAIGAIKDRSLVKKTITCGHFPFLPEEDWANPNIPEYSTDKVEHTFDVFIRKRSSADSLEVFRTENRHQAHVFVMRCVLSEKGEQVFPTLEDVESLEEWLFLPLLTAVREVNQLNPKPSPPKTNSGANSRSASGGEASRNGRKRSRKKSRLFGTPLSASAGR